MASAATNLVQLMAASGILSDLVMYEHHLAARHRSPRTLESYRLTLEQFDRFLTDAEHTRRTEDVTRHDVTAFLADQAVRGYAPGTVQLRFNGLRSYFSWAADPDGRELVEKSPMARMLAPRVPLTPIKTFGADAMRKLLETCKGKDLHDRRDSAILLLAFDSGLRRNEIGDLTLADVETTTRTAFVRRCKGGKSWTASYGPRTAIAIEKYLRVRRLNRWADSPAMWIGKTGPMDGRSLNRIFDRRCHQAGLGSAPRPRAPRAPWPRRC